MERSARCAWCAAECARIAIVRDRLLYVQAVEALRVRADGVIADPDLGDVGSILGWGFPAFTGGVFSFARYVGADSFARRAREFATQYGVRFSVPVPAPAR